MCWGKGAEGGKGEDMVIVSSCVSHLSPLWLSIFFFYFWNKTLAKLVREIEIILEPKKLSLLYAFDQPKRHIELLWLEMLPLNLVISTIEWQTPSLDCVHNQETEQKAVSTLSIWPTKKACWITLTRDASTKSGHFNNWMTKLQV